MRPLVRLVAGCFLFGLLTSQARAGAQGSLPALSPPLPAQAVVGSTPARLAAYNQLTPDQRAAANAIVLPYLQQAVAQALAQRQSSLAAQDLRVHAPNIDGLVLHDLSQVLGLQQTIAVIGASSTSIVALYPGSSAAFPPNPASGQVTGSDLDHDGLPDAFENQLADAFTPVYFVSGGETDNFATFLDSVPETVAQRQGQNPLSYFRVKPLGFATGTDGVEYGFVKINYLTLWDHDSGLVISGSCDALIGLAGGVLGIDLLNLIGALTGHDLDDEHSAALVVAPSLNGAFNLDPSQYLAVSYYTAAHEGTFFDKSAFYNPTPPVPANNHLGLFLSLSKHSTYVGNPDGFPLMPADIIALYYATITDLFAAGIICELWYDYLLFVGDSVFFDCVVEHFADQGGVFASPRINVGEPVAGSTLNGSGFILDPDHVLPKLTEPLWSVASPPIIVTVSPASAFLTAGQSQQLQAAVLNAPNNSQAVAWSINPAVGSISAAGLYTAPSPVGSADAITVTACSTAASTRCGNAMVFLDAIADFAISVTAQSMATMSVNYSVSIAGVGGSPGTVSLSTAVSPAAPSIGVSLTSGTVTGSGTSQLTVSNSTTTPQQPYTITITATNGTYAHTATLTYTPTFTRGGGGVDD